MLNFECIMLFSFGQGRGRVLLPSYRSYVSQGASHGASIYTGRSVKGSPGKVLQDDRPELDLRRCGRSPQTCHKQVDDPKP